MIELQLGGDGLVRYEAKKVLAAGYTGRDEQEVSRHIEELRRHGVRSPETVPIFYPVTPDRVCVCSNVHVIGTESSGEAEAVLLLERDAVYVGVGSDHTDRALERHDVRFSKQLYHKPISRQIWRLEEVAPHWDGIELRSWVTSGGRRALYQEGTLGALLAPGDIIELARARIGPDLEGTVILCGTLPVLADSLVPGESFEAELHDPVLRRRLNCSYSVSVVPDGVTDAQA